MGSKRVLCVGISSLDILHLCKSFPTEDIKQRSLDCKWASGGNAANNATVLSILGTRAEFFGTVADDGICWEFIKKHFETHGIYYKNCVLHSESNYPTSTVILNKEKGTRTIVHSNKNLPELTLEDFKKLDLSQYSWIHFEGRNLLNLKSLISHVVEWNSEGRERITISLDMERMVNDLLPLARLADAVFLSKEFCQFNGWDSMDHTMKGVKSHIKQGGIVVCGWGESGAVGIDKDGSLVSSPAFPPDEVIDTLGAGDTLCASVIHFLNSGSHLSSALVSACRLAGGKIGTFGFTHLKEIASQLQKDGKIS